MPASSSWLRRLTRVELIALAGMIVFVCSLGGIALTRETDRIAMVWIANGVLLGMMLTAARAHWVALLAAGYLGNVAANLLTGSGMALGLSLSLCNSLEVLIAALIVGRHGAPGALLTSIGSMAIFALGAVIAAPLACSLLAAAVLSADDLASAVLIFSRWFPADALGMAIATPLMLAVAGESGAERRLLSREGLPPLALVLATSAGVFLQTRYPLLFLVLPPLMLLTFHGGYRGATIGVAIVASVAVATTLAGLGPLSLMQAASVAERILILQTFIAVALISSLTIAAVLSRERELRRHLSESEHTLRAVTDNLPALVVYFDADQRYRFVNSTYGQVAGRNPTEIIGRSIREVWGEKIYAQRANHVRSALAGTTITFEGMSHVRGADLHHQTTYVPDLDADGQVRGCYAMTFDITQLKQTQHQLDYLARHDMLTGLANRRECDARLGVVLAGAAQRHAPIAVLYLDVDHFKEINDTHGHAAGDAVLQEFARRLETCVRPGDLAARWAGDEFVVVMPLERTSDEPLFIARKILTAMAKPFALDAVALRVGTSIGLVMQGDASLTTSEQLLAAADASLYAAKLEGRNTLHAVTR